MIAKLEAGGYAVEEINAFLSQPEAILMEGRVLYPRLYRRDEGIASARPWPVYAIRDYSRIGFILLDDNRTDMIFVTKEVLDFPQGADAVVLACQKEDYLDVRLVDFGTHSYQSAPLSRPCTDN